MKYPVTTVPDQAADNYEQLGTKPKFWFQDDASRTCLFKFNPRVGQEATGEDWSEKVSSELCELLGLPHAQYDLATWRAHNGVISPSFVPGDGMLVSGNEVLVRVIQEYPKQKFYKVREHALRRVLAIMKMDLIKLPIDWSEFKGIELAIDVFVGYLMLDAWIGNQDRHHQNWGFVVSRQRTAHLAPTFDHASSLGWNETDDTRQERLTTKDKRRGMETYVERALSAFFESPPSEKPMSTLDAFRDGARVRPLAAKAWLERLARLPAGKISDIFTRIPTERITPVAAKFAMKMLELNQRRLLALEVQK